MAVGELLTPRERLELATLAHPGQGLAAVYLGTVQELTLACPKDRKAQDSSDHSGLLGLLARLPEAKVLRVLGPEVLEGLTASLVSGSSPNLTSLELVHCHHLTGEQMGPLLDALRLYPSLDTLAIDCNEVPSTEDDFTFTEHGAVMALSASLASGACPNLTSLRLQEMDLATGGSKPWRMRWRRGGQGPWASRS